MAAPAADVELPALLLSPPLPQNGNDAHITPDAIVAPMPADDDAAVSSTAIAPRENDISPRASSKSSPPPQAFYPQSTNGSTLNVRGMLLRIVVLLGLGGCAALGVLQLVRTLPPLPACDGMSLSFILKGAAPKLVGGGGNVMGTAAQLWRCADRLQAAAPERTLAVYISTYVGLQAFAIPGPLVLSIVAGAMYGSLRAQVLIAACAVCGATTCYLLSALLAQPLIERQFPVRLADLRARVEAHRASSSLPSFMLFLRLTPAVPNWFINMASPVVGVPLPIFVATTAVGLLAPNYFHANAGAALAALAASGSELGAEGVPNSDGWRQFGVLMLLQVVVLLPLMLFRRRLTTAVAATAGGKTS